MNSKQSRRTLIKNLALGASALAITPASALASYNATGEENGKKLKLKGNINHSVSRWTFNYLPLDELCKAVKEIGFSAIDLVGPRIGLRYRSTAFIVPCVIRLVIMICTKGWIIQFIMKNL